MKLHNTVLLDPAPIDGGNGNAAPPTASATPAAAATNAGGDGISLEERNRAIEKARKEEKDKLYPQIEALNAEKSRLENALAETNKTVATLQGQIEAFGNASNGGKEVNIPKLIEEVAERARREAEAVYQPTIAELNTKVSQVTTAHRQLALDKYTATKIKEAGGIDNLVPELIHGKSEEEIDASIAKSKAAFDAIRARVAGSAASNTPGNTPVVPVVPVGAASPNAGPSGNGAPKVREMSLKDYSAHRAELRAQIANRYQPA